MKILEVKVSEQQILELFIMEIFVIFQFLHEILLGLISSVAPYVDSFSWK